MKEFVKAVTFAGAVALIGTPALADPISDVCLKGGRSAALCECASDQLAATLGAEDLAVYAEVADAYLLRSAAGLPDEEAWDAAVIEVADASDATESQIRVKVQLAGNFHRDAMRACR